MGSLGKQILLLLCQEALVALMLLGDGLFLGNPYLVTSTTSIVVVLDVQNKSGVRLFK